MSYTHDQAYQASLKYFGGDDLAAGVFIDKYALRNASGELLELTPTDMHLRLTKEFARIENKYPNPLSEKEIFCLLADVDHIDNQQRSSMTLDQLAAESKGIGCVIPQGSPMSAIGNKHNIQSLSNCFVIEGCYDSYSSIIKNDEMQCNIMKRRGGVGHDISNIRPAGIITKNAARTSDGIGIFMERFSNATREVAQGGRRGALMLTIHCSHPSIETFIDIKRDKTSVTGANLSIRVDDEFMRAVENDAEYILRWPVNVPVDQAKVKKNVKARELWKKIIDAAHDNAEPGILFWDTVLREGTADIYDEFKSVATNPCFSGDTLVAVADGRRNVSFKDIAAEGKDVPVYCKDDNGKTAIRIMRNPRKTGDNIQVYKVTIEGGHTFRATKNHKMILSDGSEKEVCNLLPGDSLYAMWNLHAPHESVFPGSNSKSQKYSWIVDRTGRIKSEHRLIWEWANDLRILRGQVIHHADFNSLNNVTENLICMSKDDHYLLHTKMMYGESNPINKIKNDKKKWAQFVKKRSTYMKSKKNHISMLIASGNCKKTRQWRLNLSISKRHGDNSFENISIDNLKQKVISLTHDLGRVVYQSDWNNHAARLSCPTQFPDIFFEQSQYKTLHEMFLECAIKLNVPSCQKEVIRKENVDKLVSQGYETRINNNVVEVKKSCEFCHNDFWVNKRETSFCSVACSATACWTNRTKKEDARKFYASKREERLKAQIESYKQLSFNLCRAPFRFEWQDFARKMNVSPKVERTAGSWKKFKDSCQLFNHKVISVELDGIEDVFNGTVDEFHNFYIKVGEEGLSKFQNNTANLHVCSKNCGEIPLSPSDSCRLMLVNLTKFVDRPFEKDAIFNLDRFNVIVQYAQRLMDDIVDLELESVDNIIQKIESDPEPYEIKRSEIEMWLKIKDAARRGRRTGLGITGLGDAIAMVNIRYGSDESIKEIEKIYSKFAAAAHTSSVNMVPERGTFEACDVSLYAKSHPFFDRLRSHVEPETWNKFLKFGRRNIALTTVSPAGSVSILTQTTSGIEPVYMLSYKRRKKISGDDAGMSVDFVDANGDKWQEFVVHHHGLKKWSDVTGKTDINDSPYIGSTSQDQDWLSGVKLQATAQHYIEHAISRTQNLPNDVSREVVSNLYMSAWRQGCKGFTVYRDGCRTGVLVADTEAKVPVTILTASGQPETMVESHAPKRPKELTCDIHRINVKSSGENENYLVLVGKLNGNPYEIFCGLSQHVEVPKKSKTGTLIKNGKKDGVATYNLSIPIGTDDELLFKNIVELFSNPNHGAMTRTLSLALRHGVPVQYMVEQLQKDKLSGMQTFSKAIARVLKGYILDGAKSNSDKICGQCNIDGLVYKEGCVTCMSCGWSKC